MSNTENTRPFVNCEGLRMWKMIDEKTGTYAATPTLDFSDRLTTYGDSVQTNSTPLYGDGKLIETAVSEGPGTLTHGVHHVTDSERQIIYGEKNVGGTSVSTGHEIAPYFCTALKAVKRDGRVNLRKWFKVAYQKHDENVTQLENNGIQYSLVTLTGTYSENTAIGMKVARREVDPNTTAGAAFIERWFSEADFIGDSTLVNTSTFTANSSAITDGAELEEGTTVTLSASATGGTTPYSYTFLYKAESDDYWTAIAQNTATATQTFTLPDVAEDTPCKLCISVKDSAGAERASIVSITVTAGE